MLQKFNKFFNTDNNVLYLIFLSFIFVLTIQQFELYKGNAAHLIHSIKFFDTNIFSS